MWFSSFYSGALLNVLQEGRCCPLQDDVSFGYVALPVYPRKGLWKVGRACKLAKAGIFHRVCSNSGLWGLIADRCHILILLKLDKRVLARLIKIFRLKMKTWERMLIPPLPVSSLSVLSSDCFLSHKQSKSQPPGNPCSQGLVLVLLQTLLHTEPVHNCTVSASHEETGNIYATRIKKVTLINSAEGEKCLQLRNNHTSLHVGSNLCWTCSKEELHSLGSCSGIFEGCPPLGAGHFILYCFFKSKPNPWAWGLAAHSHHPQILSAPQTFFLL